MSSVIPVLLLAVLALMLFEVVSTSVTVNVKVDSHYPSLMRSIQKAKRSDFSTGRAESMSALSADDLTLGFDGKKEGKHKVHKHHGDSVGSYMIHSVTPIASPSVAVGGDISQHSSTGDCWVVVNGVRYNITGWTHSGGQNKIRCGSDISAGLHRKHGNQYDTFFEKFPKV